MKQIIYNLAFILLFIQEALAYGYQFSSRKWIQKGQTSIASGDTDGWSLTSTNAYYKTCTGTVTELLNRDLFTLRSGYSITKTYTNLPPHWSVGVRFDLVVAYYGSGCLTIDGNSYPCYQYYSYTNSYNVCTSRSENFQRVYTNSTSHTNGNLVLKLSAQYADLILGLVEIYLDLCDSSCLKCNGPTSSQCTSCDPSCSPLVSGMCLCPTGQYMLNGKCYGICPSGYVQNPDTTQKTCVVDYCSSAPQNVYCSTCKTSTLCLKCKIGYFYYKGQCVSECPPEAPKDSTGICKDPTIGKWNAKYLVYELFSKSFSESEISGAKFKINSSGRFYGDVTWTKFTDCGDYRFFAGYNVYGPGSQINYSFTLPSGAKYSSFLISFLFGQIDNYETGEFVNFIITNSKNQEIKRQSITGNGKDLICGRTDQQELFQYQYINVTVTTPDTYNLIITNSLGQIENESFGMREFIVIVDYSGFFGNKKNWKCEKCTSPCAECIESATKCIKCDKSNLYLDDYQCVINCQNKKYKDDSTMRCEKCNIQCGECTGPFSNQCTTCDLEDGFLLATTCVQDCGDGYFPVSDPSYVCQKCHKTCKTCKSPGLNTSCTSCNNQYLTPQGQCMDTCPIGYYQDPSIYQCKQCHETCETCSDQYSISCLTCRSGRYFLNGLCVKICPSNTFPLELKGCQPCHSSCATCNGYFPQNCLSCKLGNYLQNGTCVQTCQTGFYGNNETGLCSQCDPFCASCFGKEVFECNSCNKGYSLSGNTCGSKCPIGQYQDSNLNSCSNCHFECYTCGGPNKNDCTGCKGERYLDQQLYLCDSSCPEKTYKGENNVCQPCHATCLSCLGPSQNDCIKCSQGSYLYQNQCLLACPDGYFSTERPFLCNKCHESCAQCQFGAQDSDCTQCAGNYYLDGTKCVETCPKGSFGSQKPNLCLPCHPSCAECSGPNFNQCTTCQDKSYLFQNICQTECPKGYQPSLIKKECIRCEEGCNTCSVQDPAICLSCEKGTYLHQNKCISQCPDGTYLGTPSITNPNRALNLIQEEDELNKSQDICLNCADDCRKCSGSFKQDCTEWFEEREINYAEYRIFWIFFAKTMFCFMSLIAGFYLDYRDEINYEEKMNNFQMNSQEGAKSRMIQLNNAKITPLNKSQFYPANGPLQVLPNSSDKNSNINEIETVKSYDEKQSPLVDEKDLFSNKNSKKRQRLNLNQLQNNSLKYNELNKNTEINAENDQTKNYEADFLFHQSENKNQTNGSALAQTNIKNQAQNENEYLKTKNQKSPIFAFLTFFEITQLFVYKNIAFMRPIRVLVYYCKLLFIFLITSYLSSMEYYLIGFCMVGLLLTVKLVHQAIIYLGTRFQSVIMLCFAVFIVFIFLHVKMFMFPEIARISFPQDTSWSDLYLYTFLADLALFQVFYLMIQIIITYDFSSKLIIKYDIFHKILKILFFKDQLKNWIEQKDQ
ncbi:hypothetical protein ABPG74_002602 [Tetrahymena malaccensis]